MHGGKFERTQEFSSNPAPRSIPIPAAQQIQSSALPTLDSHLLLLRCSRIPARYHMKPSAKKIPPIRAARPTNPHQAPSPRLNPLSESHLLCRRFPTAQVITKAEQQPQSPTADIHSSVQADVQAGVQPHVQTEFLGRKNRASPAAERFPRQQRRSSGRRKAPSARSGNIISVAFGTGL